MTSVKRLVARAIALSAPALLAGCVYSKEVKTEKTVPVSPVAVVSAARVITYPDGRYQLYGDGEKTPYFWVWIPQGSTLLSPPPPPPTPGR